MGAARLLQEEWHRDAGLRGVGSWYGTEVTRRSYHHRHRQARPQNPGPSTTGLAVQRTTAPLTTSTSTRYIKENFDISTLPDEAMNEISQGINTRVRLNTVVETGIPGFIPRGK